MATTQKLCDDVLMDQETTYLTRLESVVSWWFDAGRLALTYSAGDGSDFGYLLFERMAD
jgi:heat shock protein HslJ